MAYNPMAPQPGQSQFQGYAQAGMASASGDPNDPWQQAKNQQDEAKRKEEERIQRESAERSGVMSGTGVNQQAFQTGKLDFGGGQAGIGMAGGGVGGFGVSKQMGQVGATSGQKSMEQGFLDWAREARNREKMQLDTSQSDQVRAQQQEAIDLLRGLASGNAPSAAELQMNRGTAQLQQALASQAAGIRGGNAGANARAVANAMQGAGAQNVEATAQLRAAEQAQYSAALAQALQGVRGQDLGAAGANLTAGVAQQGQNDALTMGLGSLSGDAAGRTLTGSMAGESLRVGTTLADKARQAGMISGEAEREMQQQIAAEQARNAWKGQLVGGLTSMGGSLLTGRLLSSLGGGDDDDDGGGGDAGIKL